MTIYSYARLGTWGALGNQLWEIAGTIGIANANYAEASFPKWDYQDCFSVPEHYFSDKTGDIDLSGNYLQDLIHFKDDQDLIREYFQPSVSMEVMLDDWHHDILSEKGTKIAVHVRRANNVFLPNHHPVCSLEYFEQALDMMGPGKVVVFSDDLDWCRQQSIFKDAYFAKGNAPGIDVMLLTNMNPLPLVSAALDLHLMARMDKFIISNSTFSWWSAWIRNPGKNNVIVPRPWYGPAYSHIDVKGTMIPDGWIELERAV